MGNQLATSKGDFLTNPQALNSEIVRKYLDPKGTATDEELAYFIAQAKAQNLNPFTKEIYFIKFGNQPAQIVTAKSAFEKKADSHPQYDGTEAGVIYDENGEIKHSNGAFIPRGAEILGGWAKVYRKDRSHPTVIEVSFDEYDNSKIRARAKELKSQGKEIIYPLQNQYGKVIGENNWDTMPCVMIRKVAVVSAYREAFPAELGSLYDADELQLNTEPKDITPTESQEEVKARKMKEIEDYNQQKTSKSEPKQGELIDSELVEDSGQGALFDEAPLEY
ncbi:phage recombination protein Bet [Streptococcus iniae]|uniref:phage recombination protein Bet n=1 Tax=Streptococcus iniae TaxID=1346 RepID=UPI00217CC5FA|nr:phage recombination protein Bet [Streptococcus iniae]